MALDAARARVGRALGHRGFPLLAAVLAVSLGWPALHIGFLIDDYHQRAALLDPPGAAVGYVTGRGLGDLFLFFDGMPARVEHAMETGAIPWWSNRHARISFYRPLSALTHRLDYWLWPDSPVAMHAHSLAWFAALVLVVAAFYRRFLASAAVAGIATLAFAIDDAHATGIAWIAQRNILCAAVFGFLAVLAHDRWRMRGSRVAAAGSALSLGVSLLFGDAAVASLAYLVAHALFIDRGDRRSRALALAPSLAVVAVWRLAVTHAGYGTANIDFYIDPSAEPVRFLSAVLVRMPVLFLGLMSPIPAVAALFSPASFYPTLLKLGVAVMAVLGLAVTPVLRRDPVARFFAAGMLLSFVPFCATFPHDRVLIFPAVGAMGLVAQFLAFALGDRPPRTRFARAAVWTVAAALILVHLLLAPIMRPVRIRQYDSLNRRLSVEFPADEPLAGTAVVVVNGPCAFWATHLPLSRAALRRSVPRLRVPYASLSSMRLERPDARTLLLRAGAGYMAAAFDGLYNTTREALPRGYRVDLSDVSIEVTDLTPDGRPAQIAARFNVPLEDASLRFLQWRDGGYRAWTPPAIGGAADLPAMDFPE